MISREKNQFVKLISHFDFTKKLFFCKLNQIKIPETADDGADADAMAAPPPSSLIMVLAGKVKYLNLLTAEFSVTNFFNYIVLKS